MQKIYPSSVSPVTGCTTSGYNKSCPRYFSLSKLYEQPWTEIHPIYKAIGTLGEAMVQKKIEDQLKKEPKYQLLIEVPVKHQVSDEWVISGRIDFWQKNLLDADKSILWEVKTSLSAPKARRIIRDGIVDPDHIGQLVTYLVITNLTRGVYSFTHLKYTPKNSVIEENTREFRVELKDNLIYIDDVLWEQHTVLDYIQFYRLMMEASESKDLPAKTNNQYACMSCPFSATCSRNPSSRDEFDTIYSELGPTEAPPRKEPKL